MTSAPPPPRRYLLTSLYLYLSDRCNLRCGNCRISLSRQTGDTKWIDMAAIDDVITDALPVGELMRLNTDTRLRARSYPDLRIFFHLPPAFQAVEDLRTSGLQRCRILNILEVLANGDISICGIGQGHAGLRMGNILGDSITGIWQSPPLLVKLREVLPGRLKPPCSNCIFRFQCMGGCRALAFACNDDLLAPFFLCREMHAAGRFPSSRMIVKEGGDGLQP